ncbi:MAG: ABC transporter permease subunit [Clostridia bacterium]|nr:ABC transporter permease subunit [Clostridia bacterium]
MKAKKRLLGIVIPVLLLLSFFILFNSFQFTNSFDETVLNVDHIYSDVEEFTSATYSGRKTGTIGNEETLEYIEKQFREIGVAPGGINEQYYQPFTVMVPNIDENASFAIISHEREVIKEFVLYEDYNLLSYMNGGSIDFTGEVVLLEDTLFLVNPDIIKDRIVIIESGELNASQVDYVIQNGGKGVFCCADVAPNEAPNVYETEKTVGTWGKTGESIGVGYISFDMYEYLKNYTNTVGTDGDERTQKIISNVILSAKIEYPIVNTSNIIGKLDGRSSGGEVLLITANIDGVGMGTDGGYFPGAVGSSSGVATLLEAARVVAAQKNLPYQTIYFICFNGQLQQYAGSQYYGRNPVYPLEKSTVISLELIGRSVREGTAITPANTNSLELRDSIVEHSQAAAIVLDMSQVKDEQFEYFSYSDVRLITFGNAGLFKNVYEDNIENVDINSLNNASLVLTNYIKKEIYKDTGFGFLNVWDKISKSFNKSVSFISNIFSTGTDTVADVEENFSIILDSFSKSLWLILSTLVLAVVIGISTGLYAGYRSKRQKIESLGTLIAFSIPDVLLVLLGWTVSIFYSQNFPQAKEALPINDFIIPLITLCIIPIIYISRITYITTQEESKKDYIKNAKAKGLSKRRIYFNELLPASLFKAIDSLPTIMTMIISNLIVVEFLFRYLGVGYYLIFFYSKKAYYQFLVIILVIACMYILFTWIVRIFAKFANPLKHEVRK